MARSHARLQLGVFSTDNDLRCCSPHAKLLYVLLLQDPALNWAGVVVLREAMWADDAGLTRSELDKALTELVDRRFVVVDRRTAELLVRTFIRNDKVYEQPNVLKSSLSQALQVLSPSLRRALAAELRRLPPRLPDKVAKNGRTVSYPDPHACADQLAPEGPPNPVGNSSWNPSDNPSVGTLPVRVAGTPGGGGGGGGGSNSPPVATPVERTTGTQKRADSDEIRTAQEITRAYTERVPLSKFPAVLGIVRRGMKAGHPPDAVQAALLRLADDGRPVTVDALRVELEGLPTNRQRNAPQRPTADDKIAAWQSLKTGTDDRPMYALPGGEHP